MAWCPLHGTEKFHLSSCMGHCDWAIMLTKKLHNIAWGDCQEGSGYQERPPLDSSALSQLPVGIRNKECSNLASQRMTSSHGRLAIFYPQLNTFRDASGHMQLHQDRGAGPSSIRHVSSHSVNRYLLSAYYVTGISSKVKNPARSSICLSVCLSIYSNICMALGSDRRDGKI